MLYDVDRLSTAFLMVKMKSLTLLGNRIKQLFIKSKVVFVLFITVGILNSVVFAFLYGNMSPAIRNYNSTAFQYRTYLVYFKWETLTGPTGETNGYYLLSPDRNYVSEEDVRAIIDTGLFESVVVGSLYNPALDDPVHTVLPDDICACAYGSTDYLAVNNGTAEFTSGNQAVMDEYRSSRVGGKAQIRGEEYEIIGLAMMLGTSYLIPYEKYKKIDPLSNYIELISKDRWHINDKNVPMKKLAELFPDACIVFKGGYWEKSDRVYSERNIPYIIQCFAITMISFAFLLDHLTSQLTDENAVSLIVGGRPSDIAAMAILEGTVFSLVTVVLGLVVHYALYDTLFCKINAVPMEYRFSDYLNTFFIMALISLVVMVVRSIKYLRYTPQKLRNKNL